MRTHKSDENMPDCKLYNHHKMIFVTPDVKDIMLVSYSVAKLQNSFDFQKKIGYNF